ncbi:MAG: hypothetical protein L0H55_14790 [Candidatus Nitrosocosmicus sp.]|nr:hypothetical protein [Candidatus Nitrosocosmicus sp.]
MNRYITQKYTNLLLLVLPILLAANLAIGNSNILQSVSAQTTGEGVDSFSATGYTGQILTLPPSITQVPASNNESSLGPTTGSVIGGNWSFTVGDGQLENFTWNANSYTLAGVVDGTFSINGVNDAGPLDTSSDSIQLEGNNTSFTGTADVEINNETAFDDVPVVLYLLNGNIVSLTISHEETEGLFSLPLYGIVTSLTQ